MRTRNCKGHWDRLVKCRAGRCCRTPCSPGRLQHPPPQCSAFQHPLTSSHWLQRTHTAGQPSSALQSPGASVGLGCGAWLLPSWALTCTVPAWRGLGCVVDLRHREFICVLPAKTNGSVIAAIQAALPESHPAAPDLKDSLGHLSPSLQLHGSQGHSQGCSHFSWVPEGEHSLLRAFKKKEKTPKSQLARHHPIGAPDLLHPQSCFEAPVGQAPPRRSDWGTGPEPGG